MIVPKRLMIIERSFQNKVQQASSFIQNNFPKAKKRIALRMLLHSWRVAFGLCSLQHRIPNNQKKPLSNRKEAFFIIPQKSPTAPKQP